jgi:NAD(P)-dependent dehydrogenase (short-subunit alcohol dehydrogenase family)
MPLPDPMQPSTALLAYPNVRAIPLDITDRSAIAALPDRLPAALTGVVNNAGIIVNGPVEGLSLDDLTRQLDVNVISQIAVTQAVLPKIREARGRVVFISSVSGLFTTPGTGAYNASKYAIESWPMHSVWGCVRGGFPSR